MRRFLLVLFSAILFFSSAIAAKVNKSKICDDLYTHNYQLPGDSNQIKILANYSTINSISSLLDSFQGKPVFIDLWATWCSPCLEEFKFSDSLYKYLTKNGIEIIYVSFDKETEDSVWRIKLNENKLFGNHVRANKLLRDDLTTLIWGGVDAYSIPDYLLFDRDKKLLNKSNVHPDTKAILFREIAAELNIVYVPL